MQESDPQVTVLLLQVPLAQVSEHGPSSEHCTLSPEHAEAPSQDTAHAKSPGHATWVPAQALPPSQATVHGQPGGQVMSAQSVLAEVQENTQPSAALQLSQAGGHAATGAAGASPQTEGSPDDVLELGASAPSDVPVVVPTPPLPVVAPATEVSSAFAVASVSALDSVAIAVSEFAVSTAADPEEDSSRAQSSHCPVPVVSPSPAAAPTHRSASATLA